MIEFRVARGSGKTGDAIKALLHGRGLLSGGELQGIVSYGVRYTGDLPCLNANARQGNKYEELKKLHEKGISVPRHSTVPLRDCDGFLGRSFSHAKGRDIKYYPPIGRTLLVGAHDYFVENINKIAEYRVWAYRGTCLAVYEKVKTYKPRKYRRQHPLPLAWNWDNGYAFEFRHPEEHPLVNVRKLGCDAVKALELDFGAVDLIADRQGTLYVLEVNTAPGTQGEARQGVTSLVNHIEKWVQGGFKRRKERPALVTRGTSPAPRPTSLPTNRHRSQ